ncbi:MAG TPA: apolipoprotein N-acyltransferase [Gemmataceae bacterium]|jgi:apolipoprotein N-acyltransferase|nr:apolipoprotein N-acyltransferase [Gemmataceae bacterium]
MESQQALKEEARPRTPSLKTEIMRESINSSAKTRTLLPALLSAALLWACYFPLNAGWLIWVALVPLLSLVRSDARPRSIYLSASGGALAFFTVSLQWVRVADYRMYATWIGLSIWCALFIVAAVYLIRRLDRRTSLPLLLTVPLVWTGLEFLRAHLITGFPWYFLAHAQHNYLPVIQISDLGGAYAVTFLIAAVNAMVFELLYRQRWFRRLMSLPLECPQGTLRGLRVQSAVVAVMLGATLAYGAWRLHQETFTQGPMVALLQGNLDQRLRILASTPGGPEEALKHVQRHYAGLCDEAAAREPDLIVWPETSFLGDWEELKNWRTSLLLGMNTYVLDADGREHRYNSAVMARRGGRVAGRYDKMHCVPFGEYVPLRDWIPWMNKLAPYDFDYSITPGQRFTRFPLGNYHFGVVICYEDTDPTLARQYVHADNGEPPADFLINISNDGWFDGTSEHEEHLAICRFRAIECRRAVARAVNMGISAVIDGNGRIIALPGEDWEKSKKIDKVLRASVPIDHRGSVYARFGDWLPWTCWLAIGSAFFYGFLWPKPAGNVSS